MLVCGAGVNSRGGCDRCAPRRGANAHSRAAVGALFAIAVVVFSERHAQAESPLYIEKPIYFTIGGSAAGAASIPFLVADVAYTVEHRWLPPGWAIPQIAIGGGVNAAVAISGLALYSNRDCFEYSSQSWSAASGQPFPQPHKIGNLCGDVLAVAIGTAVLSVGFIAHGVASLVLYEAVPARKASGRFGLESQGPSMRWLPDVVVTRDGNTLVAFSGVF